jgi:hypothetical protein
MRPYKKLYAAITHFGLLRQSRAGLSLGSGTRGLECGANRKYLSPCESFFCPVHLTSNISATAAQGTAQAATSMLRDCRFGRKSVSVVICLKNETKSRSIQSTKGKYTSVTVGMASRTEMTMEEGGLLMREMEDMLHSDRLRNESRVDSTVLYYSSMLRHISEGQASLSKKLRVQKSFRVCR